MGVGMGRMLDACETMVYGIEKSRGCSDERSWYFHSWGWLVELRERSLEGTYPG